MKISILLLLLSTLACRHSFSFAQQVHYTRQEAAAIHDSINHSRWDVGGRLSHYSFRYMSEFFPVSIIHKPQSASPFLYKPLKSIERVSFKSDSGNVLLENYLHQLHIGSMMVVHKGTIVYEKYFTHLPEDQHSLQSVSKVITSALVTCLINNKTIDPAKPVEQYIPELKNTDWQGISVKDILNMRSGMDSSSIDFESGPFTNPKHRNYQLESALGLLPKKPNTPDDAYGFIASLKKEKAPGIDPEYSNINTFVLGWLAEKVTGKKYADLVTEFIWKPMGASSDAYMCLSDKGIPWPHGGISATLRDLARFGMLFTKSGVAAQKERIISRTQIKEIFDTPPIKNFFAPFKWGYQWDLADDGMMMKGGFGGQALLVNPEKEIVIAYFNFVDKNWEINNMVDDMVIQDIIKAIEAKNPK